MLGSGPLRADPAAPVAVARDDHPLHGLAHGRLRAGAHDVLRLEVRVDLAGPLHLLLRGHLAGAGQVEKLLHDILVEEASHTLTAEVIQRKVAEHYRIQMSDMTSKRRMQNIAFPRQVAMYLATQLTGMSLVSIGQAFGGRDHGTVIHARKTVVNQMEVDTNVRRTVEYLRAQLSMNR